MFWTFLLTVSSFALGIAAARRWPQDGALAALADVAEAPFRLAAGYLAQAKTPDTPPPLASGTPSKRTEKPAA